MSEYSSVKSGKLSLKGEKKRKKHKKKRKHEDDSSALGSKPLVEDPQSILDHGNWWCITTFDDITSAVAIEFAPYCYMKALDNGLFTLGPPHSKGDVPAPEEILTAVRVSDTKIALKSGYGKYLRVNSDGRLTGRSDAIGSMEQFEPVFQEGQLAILGCNDCFISCSDESEIVALSKKAGVTEMIKMRSNATNDKGPKSNVPTEERGRLADCEVNYVKKFQSFQDRRLRVNEGDRSSLKKAKTEGNLHEILLDRRAKMKADRYCK